MPRSKRRSSTRSKRGSRRASRGKDRPYRSGLHTITGKDPVAYELTESYRSGGLSKRLFYSRAVASVFDGVARAVRYLKLIHAPLSIGDKLFEELPILENTKCKYAEGLPAPTTTYEEITIKDAFSRFKDAVSAFLGSENPADKCFVVDTKDSVGLTTVFCLMRVSKTHNQTWWRTLTRKEQETMKDVLLMVTNKNAFIVYPSKKTNGHGDTKLFVRFPGKDFDDLLPQIHTVQKKVTEVRNQVPIENPLKLAEEADFASEHDEREPFFGGTDGENYRAVEVGAGSVLGGCALLCLCECVSHACASMSKGKR